MRVIWRFRALVSLILLAIIGWACSESVPESPTFDLPSEVVPDWVNPTDMATLFPDAGGCFVGVGDGVRVLQVFEGTKAFGVLRAGDVITSVDGVPTNSREALLSLLTGLAPGESLRMAGRRAGVAFELEVELTGLPEDPLRGIVGIVPETRLRVVRPAELPGTASPDPSGGPVVLDGGMYWHSPLAASWVPFGGVEGVRAVALEADLYAVAAGEAPALVRLTDRVSIPIDPGPVPVESPTGPMRVLVTGFETALSSVGNLLLIAGTVTQGGFDSFAIHAVDPVEGSVVWTRPLGRSPSGQELIAVEGYRSPSGARALVSLVEQDPETGARSAVLTYYLLDEQGEGVVGPSGIDRFIPTSGVTGWHDDDSMLYVAELDGTGVAVWNLTTGDHNFIWPVPPENESDLVTVTPVGDGRHLVQIRANEVSLVDVYQPLPVRTIALGCGYTPTDGTAGAGLPLAVASEEELRVEDADGFVLTILHSSAGESRLLPDEGLAPGAARFVTVMRQLQDGAQGDGPVTLGSGGNIRASPELEVSLAREGPLYDSIALSGIYDAIALGSGDFNLGPEVAGRLIEGFAPTIPFLAANLDVSQEPVLQSLVDRGLISRSAVVDAGGERIGVIGVVTSALPDISSPRNARASRIFPAVQSEVARLEELGIDKILLVANLQDLFEEARFAGSLSGVDVVVSGGGNYLLRNEGDSCLQQVEAVAPYPIWLEDGSGREVPLVAVPGWYRCIGELRVTFDAQGNVLAAEGRSVGVGLDVPPDPGIQAEVVVPLATAVGRFDAQAIAVTEVELDGRISLLGTAATNAGNLMADALLNSATQLAEAFGSDPPDVAIQHAGSIRNNSVIPAGDITIATTWDIAPFDSFVAVGYVPREVFLVLLEQALDRVPDAGDHFPQISGFRVKYDPAAAAREIARDRDCSLVGDPGARVQDVVLDDGTVIVANGEVVPGAPVVIATLDFLALGGECYPLAGLPFTNLGVSYRQALARYISEGLDGVITATDYPLGGGDRLVAVESRAAVGSATNP
ncbi:MAG: 5'-nucleotidase C-terminal domain-containing protein [bacterium]|nr:5'-nucleotidase C-terminal domain-containing protein [bacterium]MDE0289648.1 5'-nucleotidase C-terminal domain-containing protein [bacterium]MDE0437922.1 5'-nucleotidase C-terminal domain-containing protein [bacterium]